MGVCVNELNVNYSQMGEDWESWGGLKRKEGRWGGRGEGDEVGGGWLGLNSRSGFTPPSSPSKIPLSSPGPFLPPLRSPYPPSPPPFPVRSAASSQPPLPPSLPSSRG